MTREALILDRLSGTPHVVRFHEHFSEASETFSVIELMKGNSTDRRVKLRDLGKLLHDVSFALTRIHGMNMAHMDVHPSSSHQKIFYLQAAGSTNSPCGPIPGRAAWTRVREMTASGPAAGYIAGRCS